MKFSTLHISLLESIKKSGRHLYGPVYHGTNADVDGKLTTSKSGSRTDWGILGKGVYFTGSKSAAKGWSRGGIVISANLKMKNPFIYNNESVKKMRQSKDPWIIMKERGHQADNMTKYLKKKGYDGVIAPEIDEYLVFNDDQIIYLDDNT